METLGNRIARLRKRKEITQDELAEYMGISPQAVSKWENDITCPDITALPKLADYFNVTVDELLRGESQDKVKVVAKNERGDPSGAVFRLKVLTTKGDKVNINLPLMLLKSATDSGMDLGSITGKSWLGQIDLGNIVSAAESGILGKFLEVESADGDIVEGWIEL
ncbi:MAG TPA: helix-turn-helix transcriptional regulator [Oscillospiraceae bacterium]|nr:helix-turn-helix transcriptional regulator [Oscillospiraceae bacterium]HPS34434.1 helix-turn-helix transcriptional regulator [Oscillospiraceae bacterium]